MEKTNVNKGNAQRLSIFLENESILQFIPKRSLERSKEKQA